MTDSLENKMSSFIELSKGPALGGVFPERAEVGDQFLLAVKYRKRHSGKPYLAWVVATAFEGGWVTEDGSNPNECDWYAKLNDKPINELNEFVAAEHIHLVPPELVAKWAKEDEEYQKELEHEL